MMDSPWQNRSSTLELALIIENGYRFRLTNHPAHCVFEISMFRKVLFWLHLGAGVLAGLIILMMSVTGVMMTYERQLQSWEDGPYYYQPAPGEQRLTIDELILAANRTEGFKTDNLILASADDAPFIARMGRSRTQHLNPYTGEIHTPHSDSLSGFFAGVRALHRWFMMTGEARSTARDITGAANLLFLFLLLSGSYLWLPKVFTWATLKVRVWFNPLANTSAARDFNWHHVFAFWAAIPLIVIIPTASVFNYGWANTLVYTLAGDTPPERSNSAPPNPEEEPRDAVSLDVLVSTAHSYSASWNTLSFSLPAPGAQNVPFTLDEGNGGEPQKRHTVTVNRVSGAAVAFVPFTDQSPGVQARRWVRFLHTGEALGLGGQTLAGLASAAAALLVWTGLSLALRRFLRWRVRTNNSISETATPQSS